MLCCGLDSAMHSVSHSSETNWLTDDDDDDDDDDDYEDHGDDTRIKR